MSAPEIVLLLARADNGVIGDGSMGRGTIPWHIPGEQRRFKAMTMGTPMVMGRKTFDSLPRLLPGRRHIVMTYACGWSAPGAEAVRDVDSAIALADAPVISVIGGAEIYRLFLPYATRVELTEVHVSAKGDAVVPAFGAEWREVAREDFPAEGDAPAYSYVTLRRGQ